MNINFEELLEPLTEAEEESYIQQIMNMRYTREEAINILQGLNPNGSKFEELSF